MKEKVLRKASKIIKTYLCIKEMYLSWTINISFKINCNLLHQSIKIHIPVEPFHIKLGINTNIKTISGVKQSPLYITHTVTLQSQIYHFGHGVRAGGFCLHKLGHSRHSDSTVPSLHLLGE